MAANYNAPFDEPGEVREGFLCPLCLKDLQSFYQLQSHYEEEHSNEDRDVKGQLKNLVQMAKKAKNKLLKRDEGERTEAGNQERYEAFSYGGVDPCMWDPQEIGAVRSHLSDFKRHRAARIDHYVVEINKLIIRLEKLTSFDRVNTDSAKIRAIEKSVVPWVSDQDVPFCPDCGNKFSIRNRRHHCRLCGSIMCKRCTELLTLPLAMTVNEDLSPLSGPQTKLTSAHHTRVLLTAAPTSPRHSAQASPRAASAPEHVSSVLEEKDDDRIPAAGTARTPDQREQKMDANEHNAPEIVNFYQCCSPGGWVFASQETQHRDNTLNSAATECWGDDVNLDHANSLRIEVQKHYELIDALSKKILTPGIRGAPASPEGPAAAGWMRGDERKRDAIPRSSDAPNGELSPKGRLRKAEGWLPTSGAPRNRETSDPLLQQIENITSYIRQAREAGRTDEMQMLEDNLRQLQEEYDQQQMQTAIQLSRELAEEEAMQREQLEVLERKEVKREQRKSLAQHNRTHSLDFREQEQQGGWQDKQTAALDLQLPRRDLSPLLPSPGATQDTLEREAHTVHISCPTRASPVLPRAAQIKAGPSNPFEDEEDGPAPAVPDHSQQNGRKEYNPFNEANEKLQQGEERPSKGSVPVPSNPFENRTGTQQLSGVSRNPFEDVGAGPGNPFEEGESWGAEEAIEEDLLLQQIDNIKAYIFDAKHSGRLDEVEVLTENLRELKQKLAKQKGPSN
ncbi:hypothetical protein FKM82_004399 [Ascaphus truei]